MEVSHRIIDAAREGDSSAFEQIVRECSTPVFRYANNLLGNEHAAEEVVQQVFMKLLTGLSTFDPERGNFSAWIYRIARNTAFNSLRDAKPAHIHYESVTPVASGSIPPDEELELREGFDALDRALASLPTQQRSAWVLAELEGLSIAEIAKIEGVPEGTVKSRVSRAKQSLRQALREFIGTEHESR